MKKLNKMTKGLLLLTLFLGRVLLAHAQTGAPPPPPGGGHGQTENQPAGGGGAPIAGGVGIMISLIAVYGGRKAYNYYQTQKQGLEE